MALQSPNREPSCKAAADLLRSSPAHTANISPWGGGLLSATPLRERSQLLTMGPTAACPSKSPAVASDAAAAFRIAINLDITGSMSAEIEGVKQTVSQLITLLNELEVPLALAILTFTESNKGCYCSCVEFAGSSLEAAQEYVQRLRLSVPPDEPSQSASGDDGDENQKASLHRMVDLEPMPTIAFLITDASPHMKNGGATGTQRQELRWLEARGLPPAVAADLFRVFSLVMQHYQDQLVLNCIIYNSAAHEVYGSLAQRTGGMLMQPISRSPAVLARGMLDVVRSLLAGLQGSTEGAVLSLEGYQLFDVSALPPRECEEDPAGPRVIPGNNAELFAVAMQRLVSVCGAKWTKRAIGMTAPAEQLEFVWRTARYVTRHLRPAPALSDADDEAAAKRELRALEDLRERIVAQLPGDVRGHFSIDAADILQLAAAVAFPDIISDAVSAMSLETVGDALADDADWSDWLATVMRLLYGYPITLQLPKDKFGKPDLMDAWSSVTLALGIDCLSASDFLQLLDGGSTALGPTDKREHNALLLLVKPRDKLASLVFRIASGTQVLNYVSGLLMGARGFLPNLHAGTAAACLLRLLGSAQPLTSFQQDQAAQIVHTLRCLHRPPASAVGRQLREGRANPADAVSKLLVCLVRTPPGPALHAGLRLVLEEWVGAMAQRHYGKGAEADAEYLASLLAYIPLDCIFDEVEGKDANSGGIRMPGAAGPGAGKEASAEPKEESQLDPLRQLHPLELPVAEQLASFRSDWQARLAQRLRQGDLACGLPPHPVWVQFQRSAEAMLHLLTPPVATSATPDAAPEPLDLPAVWPDWEQGVVRALLLRHRTARYRCVSAEGAKEASWEPLGEREVGSTAELTLARLNEGHADILRGYRQARLTNAEQRLLAAAVAALRTMAALSPTTTADNAAEEEARVVAVLRDLYLDLRGAPVASNTRPEALPRGPAATLLDASSHRLDRGCVPDLLLALGPDAVCGPTLRALVLGDWTSSPPQALRRYPLVLQRCQELALDDVLQVLRSVPRCVRQGRCNRLGHTAERPYPGPAAWTQPYADARLADRPSKAAYVAQMQRFTQMAAWARQAALVSAVVPAGCSRDKVMAEVEVVLMAFDDANRLDRVQASLEQLLDQRMAIGTAMAVAAGGV